ncbi:MAG: UvrD-helicase domain-containing protein [Bacillota bacterium]|nr:UvrD-helicase domain-containing protein [Bacillota bacterium]
MSVDKVLWTPDQARAIQTRNVNMLVSAGAGSGKTAVLVERVIQMMQDRGKPVDIDRFLVVTFTEAAAREMKRRIAQAIARGIAGGPDEARFKRQALLFNRASISTLHSFCARILRRHFYVLDLDPAFRVMDEVEATLARGEVLERLLLGRQGREGDASDPAGRLFSRFGDLGSTARLSATLDRIYAFARSQPEPHAWLKQAGADRTVAWMAQSGRTALANLQAARASLDAALRTALRPGGPSAYVDCISGDLSLVTQALQDATVLVAEAGGAGTWDALRSAVAKDFGRLSPARKCDEALKGEAQYLRDSAKEAWRRARAALSPESAGALAEGLAATQEDIAAIILLVLDFDREFSSYKRSHGLVDFSDLEQMCYQALKSPDVRAATRDDYDEVLVDECQDISPVQEAIIELVSSEPGDAGNLFMVGDVKQSIYRFRLAEPALFINRSNRYPLTQDALGGAPPHGTARDGALDGAAPDGGAARDGGASHGAAPCAALPGVRVCLQENFRSTKSLVDALNLVFEKMWIGGPSELTYTEQDRLTSSQGSGPAPEMYLMDWSDENESGRDESDEQEDLTSVEREARLVAVKIAQMLGRLGDGSATVCDPETRQERPVQCGDIAVLLRSAYDVAPVFVEALSALGIPTYAELATGYFDAVEVKVMLAALCIVDNPRQDIPLASVLRSPLVGVDASELARIRTCAGGDFYDAVRTAAGLCDSLGVTCRHFLDMLEEWRTVSRRRPVSALIDRILADTQYDLVCRSAANGERRVRNLTALIDRAHQHDRTERPGLQRFLRFIERLRETGSDLGPPASVEDGQDCVRIMSVHKSKGLEFPVVFVPCLGRKWNRRDLMEEVLLHRDLGLGTLVCDLEGRLKHPTLAYRAIGQRLWEGSLAEEIRVLYVALTRARERLVLVGSVRNLASRLREWSLDMHSGALSPAGMLSASGFLDLLGPVVMSIPEPQQARLLVKCITDQHSLDEALGIPGDTQRAAKQAATSSAAPAVDDIASLEEELLKRLSWRYPFEGLKGRRAKVAASEVWRLQSGEGFPPEAIRSGAHERAEEAAARGVATHRVLEHLDLSHLLDDQDISTQAELLVATGKVTREQAALVDRGMIARFLASATGRLIVENRESALRELVFTMCVPAGDIYPEIADSAGAGEGVIVQGVIDCLLKTPSGQIVIDYKTDNITAGEVSEAVERYRRQAALYARAARAAGQDTRVQTILCFLRPGVSVDITSKT